MTFSSSNDIITIVTFAGNEHRSWINIIVKKQIFKDKLPFKTNTFIKLLVVHMEE